MFNMPSMRGASDLCGGRGAAAALTPATCQQRYSVFHCHILPHEDEGCIWPVKWFCPGDTSVPQPSEAQCPSAYPPCPAAAGGAAVVPDKTVRRRRLGRRL